MVKEQEKTVVDLSQHGQEFTAAFGGAGGKGNRFFLTNENRAPIASTPGAHGQERILHLELRTMAHAGLVRQRRSFLKRAKKALNSCGCDGCLPSGGVPQRREVIIAQGRLQRQARRGCVPFHNAQTTRRNRRLQGSRASGRWDPQARSRCSSNSMLNKRLLSSVQLPTSQASSGGPISTAAWASLFCVT